MTRVVVEVAFGYTVTSASPVWTDITQWVDIPTGVTTARGASDELSETQPGTCSLTLDNSDGRFSPGRASSPYYPNIKKNVPLRVSVITTAKNLIKDPGFVSGIGDWVAKGTVPPSLAHSFVRYQDSPASMLVTWGAGGTSPAAETTVSGLDIGVTYTASAYVWVPSGSNAVRLFVATIAGAGAVSTTVDAWERITYTFTATTTSHRVQVIPSGTPTGGQQVWVDAVQVEEAGSATTYDPAGAKVSGRFWGMVNEWPVRWEGLYSTASITCTDVFKWLSSRPNLKPMLVEEVLLDGPVAYYPLSEPESSTTAGDISGTGTGALAITQAGSGGTLTFGTGAGPTDSLGCPTFTPSSSTAGKYLTANLGQRFEDQTREVASNRLLVEAWFKTSTQGRVICALTNANTDWQLIFSLESGTGKLLIEDTAGSPLVGTHIFTTGNLADGVVHHVVYDEETNKIWIDGVDKGADISIITMFEMRLLSVGGFQNSRLWNGEIAHVAVYANTALSASDLTTHYTTGTTAHSGEAANTRVSRLASYVGISSVTSQGTTFGGVGQQVALGQSPLAHLRECETAESGKLLASRAAAGLVFQSRDVRYNPVPDISLAYADLEKDSVKLEDDDQKMVNTIIASRPGGATQRVIDQTSRNTYGPKEQELALLKASDNEVLDAANWTISRYADPPPELRELTVEGYTLGLTAYRGLLAADVSTPMNVTGLPAEAPAATQTVVVEGYTETIRRFQHTFAWHVSRAYTDAVWALDDLTYSVLGTTTRLAY